MDNPKVKILIIDNHPLFREGVKRILAFEKEFVVVAEGQTKSEISSLVEKYRPDIVLMDIDLTDEDSMVAIKNVSEAYPNVQMVILSFYEDEIRVMRAFEVGAVGYLLKEMATDELVNAIRSVYQEGGYIHPKVTLNLIQKYQNLMKQKQALETQVREAEESKNSKQILTSREYEILQLIASGHSNKTLGNELCISEKTVKNHVSAILRKMSVSDRTAAVVESIRLGWISV